MENTLITLHNTDSNNKVIYVNISSIVFLTDDNGTLIIGLSDGNRFHIKEKLKDFPNSFTSLIR